MGAFRRKSMSTHHIKYYLFLRTVVWPDEPDETSRRGECPRTGLLFRGERPSESGRDGSAIDDRHAARCIFGQERKIIDTHPAATISSPPAPPRRL